MYYGCRAGREDWFLNLFVHRRTTVAHSEPTKVFPKWSPETAMLSAPFRCNHPPPPILPFLLKQNLQRSLQKVTSQDESFMPDISGYVWERVNPPPTVCHLKVSLYIQLWIPYAAPSTIADPTKHNYSIAEAWMLQLQLQWISTLPIECRLHQSTVTDDSYCTLHGYPMNIVPGSSF